MTTKELKQQLNRVFDDNLRTRQWENYVDYTIIGLIIISTLQIFLSTYDSIEKQYGTLLEIVDYITIAVFTVEVSLRIWCADLLDEKYKGFWGRVRYCCSFYGLVDFLSTYSFYVALFLPIPYHILKVLRVARLLRLFRYMKAFSVLHRAISSKKDEMVVSVQFLFIVTLMLSFILFFVEHDAQPKVYDNGWTSVVWAFAQYIGDPGHFAETPPVTFIGRIIACIIGVLGIAIFAVPAGLIASGFSDSMAEMQREEELEKFHNILLRDQDLKRGRNFSIFLNKLPKDENVWYNGCQFKYIGNNIRTSKYLLKGIELKDILDVCKVYPEFRVKNRASAMSFEQENKNDTFLLEHFPINRVYGCFINRGSKVTIISTSSRAELDTGNFSFYLAKWAGFNYISKDFDADPEFSESYYNNPWLEPKVDGKRLKEREDAKEFISKDLRNLYKRKKEQREMFLNDLESVTREEGTWAICILSQVQVKENNIDVHVAHNTEDGTHETISDLETFQKMFEAIKTSLKEEVNIDAVETQRFPLIHRGAGKMRNIAYKMREDGCKCNSFTMRVSSHLLEFDSNMRIALFLMAKSVKEAIEPERPLPKDDVADMNRVGYGFMPGKEQDVENIKKQMK